MQNQAESNYQNSKLIQNQKLYIQYPLELPYCPSSNQLIMANIREVFYYQSQYSG